MRSTVDEIAPGVHRLSTFIPDVGPTGLSFNQFLIDGDEPLLFHTGMRALFPIVRGLVEQVLPVERLRWISFSHYEADECGAMNDFLAVAPDATVVHSSRGVMLSVGDAVARAPRTLDDGEVLSLGGGRAVRMIETPHVPHNWESVLLFEESTRTLLCGDLLSQGGDTPAVVSDPAVVDAAVATEAGLGQMSRGPDLVPTIHRLADFDPATLGVMHGASFAGDAASVLRRYAAGLEALPTAAAAVV